MNRKFVSLFGAVCGSVNDAVAYRKRCASVQLEPLGVVQASCGDVSHG